MSDKHSMSLHSADTTPDLPRTMELCVRGMEQSPFLVCALSFTWNMFEKQPEPYGTLARTMQELEGVRMRSELRLVLQALLDEPHVWFIVLAPYGDNTVYVAYSRLTSSNKILERTKSVLETDGVTISRVFSASETR